MREKQDGSTKVSGKERGGGGALSIGAKITLQAIVRSGEVNGRAVMQEVHR